MALSVYDHVEFRSSADLKQWQKLGTFGAGLGAHDGTWECPDLFPLQVAGTDEVKWVLIVNLNPGGPQGGSGTPYFVGDFDGRKFTLDPQFARSLQRDGAAWLDWGRDNYAGVTWPACLLQSAGLEGVSAGGGSCIRNHCNSCGFITTNADFQSRQSRQKTCQCIVIQ